MSRNHHRSALGLAAVAACAVAAVPAFGAATFSENFDTRTPGQVAGGADTRTPGGADWYTPDNSATFGEYRAGVGLGGSGALVIGNRGNGNDGVVHNVISPRLLESAGETGTNSGANGTPASNGQFVSEYSFRSAITSAPTSGELRFRSESWGNDRTTFLGFTGTVGSTGITAFVSGYDAAGNSVSAPIGTTFNYGDWYRVVTTVDFNDGGAANDVVTFDIYNASNVLVGSATTNTWEEGARQGGFNGGTPTAVDALGFQSRLGFTGDHVYVDNVSFSAVPEPTGLALIGLGGVALLGRRRRRTGSK